jgi:hypothetical protein
VQTASPNDPPGTKPRTFFFTASQLQVGHAGMGHGIRATKTRKAMGWQGENFIFSQDRLRLFGTKIMLSILPQWNEFVGFSLNRPPQKSNLTGFVMSVNMDLKL